MKLNNIKVALVGASMLVGIQLNAQKSNIVSAAVEYKKYEPAFYSQKFDEAKQVLLNSKEFLDPAMKEENLNDLGSKDFEKAHYYNAIIHFGLVELSSLEDNDDLKQFQSEETMKEIKESLKIAYESRKFKRDVEDFIDKKVQMARTIGKTYFDKKEFDLAYAGFAGAYELQKMIDIEDDEMKNNALISAKNEIASLKDEGKNDEALEFIISTRDVFPKNADLAIEGVNISLDQGDMDKAEEFFEAAAEADPDNKLLFSSMGSIYLENADKAYAEMREMEISDEGYANKSDEVEELYKKAENNLKKAIEIDPEYVDASYNLGVLYLGRGEKLTSAANQMDYNDPSYDATLKRSEEMYKKAIAPLEVYIEQDPNNVGVLNVLFQVHRRAGNSEKALEYKKRAEEAAAEDGQNQEQEGE
ncbi:MAG: tetratricopeptide repeat protein [Brumimicrobium sp.]